MVNYLVACPWCAESIPHLPTPTATHWQFDCRVCGPYAIPLKLYIKGTGDTLMFTDVERRVVSAWIRQRTRNQSNLRQTVTEDEAKNIIQSAPRLTPWEKALKLLQVMGKLSERPGAVIEAAALTSADASAFDEAEFDTYMTWLYDTGNVGPTVGRAHVVTRAGWLLITELERKQSNTGRRAFVAMSFHQSMDDAFNLAIKPACEVAGFDAYRVDQEIHGNRIDQHIIASIRESRFVIVDVTQQRNAVYYEAGFADGLGKPVIWSCCEDDKDKMCFDTRQIPHILWKTSDDLKVQLVDWIKARIV